MTEEPKRTVPATVHVHVDDINTNEYNRLLNFCSSIGFEFEIKLQSPIEEKDEPTRRPRLVTGQPRLITDEQE